MGGIPDLMFVIDTNKEAIAIQEARKLNIPVVAILDTNCDPHGHHLPIPGNDDAARALQLYCDLVADAVLDGLTEGQASMGVDIGAAEAPRSSRPCARRTAAAAPAPEPEAEAEAEAAPEPVVSEAEVTGEAAAEPEAAPEAEPEAVPDTTAAAADEAVARRGRERDRGRELNPTGRPSPSAIDTLDWRYDHGRHHGCAW